jgi:hypothetical protein
MRIFVEPGSSQYSQEKKPPKENINTLQKSSPPQPFNWHQNHRGWGRGLVLQTSHGRIYITHSNQVKRKCSKTQTHVEGPTQPRMELAGGAKVLQPHFEASVKMKLTLPKVGTWSPPGLPKPQSSIPRVKTLDLEVIFTPLERS